MMTKKLDPQQIIKDVNKAGASFTNKWEKYSFHSMKREGYRWRITVKNKYIKETKSTYFFHLVHNKTSPFCLKSNKSLEYVKEIVNQRGKRMPLMERFSFVSIVKTDKSYKTLNIKIVKVRHNKTKQEKIIRFDYITGSKYYSPFPAQFQDRDEEKVVHPIVLKSLETMGLSMVSHEKTLSKRSRPDFVFKTKTDRIIIIEVKSDKKRWSSKQISEQTKKYKTDGKKKFGNRYAKTYFVSPKGTHGCFSLRDMKLILKQDGMI